MSDLRQPLRHELADSITEEEVQRIWAGVQRRQLRRSIPVRGKGLSLVALLGLLSVAVLWFWPRAAGKELAAGPLLTTDGRLMTALGGEGPSRVEFADGSRLDLGPGVDLEVLDNNAHSWMSALRRGRVAFDVRSGGPRRWIIEAGFATVEVVGTRFGLNRTKDAVEVEVTRGAVLVRGELVRDHVQRLTAGERLVVRDAPGSPAAPDGHAAGATTAAGSIEPLASLPARPLAFFPKEARGAVAQDIDELLLRADAKRRSGDLTGAERILRRILSQYREHPRSALAAFTLGRLLFETRPREAALAFSRCLALSPPAALAEDALARLAEAEAKAGHAARARAASDDYERRYPKGRWLGTVKQWAEAN